MSDNLAQSGDIYEQLGVLRDTSAQEIHKRFLKRVMKMLLNTSMTGQIDGHLQGLQALWVAHDILIDPVTRTDYDLRALGIKTGDYEIVLDTGQSLNTGSVSQLPSPDSWRIGELLLAAGVLEQAELDIACDMHKAMPEIQFGTFLSKQGFISEKQLQAVLIGQILLRSGEITLSQFRSMMTQTDGSDRDIKEILLEMGIISKTILTKLIPESG